MAFAALPNTNVWQNRRGTIISCEPSREDMLCNHKTHLIYETPKQKHGCWQFTLHNKGQTADLILVQHFESAQYCRPLKILSIRTHM